MGNVPDCLPCLIPDLTVLGNSHNSRWGLARGILSMVSVPEDLVFNAWDLGEVSARDFRLG